MSDILLLRSYEAGIDVVEPELDNWLDRAKLPSRKKRKAVIMPLTHNRTVVLIPLNNVEQVTTNWDPELARTLNASMLLELK